GAAAGARAAWPSDAREERACTDLIGERGDDRPDADGREDRGRRWSATTRRLLLGDPARGSDPHVQRVVRPTAGLLRDRHGRARRNERGGLVHPDTDDGGYRDGLDGMPAPGRPRWQLRRRGDD